MAEKSQANRDVLALLFEVTRRLNEGARLETVLETIAGAACRVSDARDASVMLLDEDRERLLCRASHGLSEAEATQARFRLGEGIAGWVAAEGEALRIDEAGADSRFRALREQCRVIRSLCCVPLSGREGVIGVLTVTSGEPGAFAEEDEELLRFLAASVVKDVENARLYRLAVTDVLTGAFNRQYLAENLPVEMERHRRYGDPLSLAMVDVDHFKSVNDTCGHTAGDAVLVELAGRCMRAVRDSDGVVRYGGEELVLVLPQTGRAGAADLAERVRRSVADAPVWAGEQELALTVSVGVAELDPADQNPSELIARADAALYAAKAAGRNRVQIAPVDPH